MSSDLKGWLKQPPLQLPTDSMKKFKELVIAGKLEEELMMAFKYVGDLPQMEAAGSTCAIRELADIKKICAENSDGAMFSATLSQLSLDDRAMTTIDIGRIATIFESSDTDAKLKQMMGVITVNIGEGEQLRFMRANKDAEVDALCLLMYWHKGNPPVHSRLIIVASDLVFLGRTHRIPTPASPVS